MRENFFLLSFFLLVHGFLLGGTTLAQPTKFYEKSYALVIGIDNYESSNWKNLGYAVNDAEGMATYLKGQGFEVIFLKNKEAIKNRIIFELQNNIAKTVGKEDRVLMFFAGHGFTERLGEEEAFGYIVPYDGKGDSNTYISMEKLQELSRKMGIAKHQLFIMDTCYGGLLAFTGRSGAVKESHPHYLQEITRRKARLVLTAGGANEEVLDGGPNGHSVFTGHLLTALGEGHADLNGDGWITFSELASYVVPLASNRYQTPQGAVLPGHSGGEFVFQSSKGPKPILSGLQELGEGTRHLKHSNKDDDSGEEAAGSLNSPRAPSIKQLENNPTKNFSEEVRSRVKTAISALKGQTTSARVNSVQALLSSLPDDLTAREITQLLDRETTSHREQILELLVTKAKLGSLNPDDIPSLLRNETTSNRVNCIRIVAPYIRPLLPGMVAAEILNSETGSHRVKGIKQIANLIKRPISEKEIYAILKGTSGSDRSKAVALLLNMKSIDKNNISTSTKPDSEFPTLCIPQDQLELKYKIVKDMSYPTARDKALSNVAKNAICGGHFELALEASKSIEYSTTRDSVYIELIQGALAQGKISMAGSISDLIFYPSTRDAAKSLILNADQN